MSKFKLKNENFAAIADYNETNKTCSYSIFLILNNYSDSCDYSKIESGEEKPKSKSVLYYTMVHRVFAASCEEDAKRAVIHRLDNYGKVVVNNNKNNFTIDYLWKGVSIARDLYIEIDDEHYLITSTELSRDAFCITFDPDNKIWYGKNMYHTIQIDGEEV